jgi:hypothetical protein
VERAAIGFLAALPAVVYATAVAGASVGPWGIAATLGLLAALAPALGLLRRDLAPVAWLPGLFLGLVLFLVCGISVNPLPGPLGGLTGGWAVGAPVFAGLAIFSVDRAPGRRIFLLVVALLASAALLAVVTPGSPGSVAALGPAFAQVPKQQALALASILAGGAATGAPFLAAPVWPFGALVLLAGAGGLLALVGIDPDRLPEGIGHEVVNPNVPAGKYRSLLVEGRSRLEEASPPERPRSTDPGALVSVAVATLAAVGSLTGAILDPDWLLLGTAVVAGVLLGGALFVWRWSEWRRSAPPAPAVPAPTPGAAASEAL